MSFSCRRISEYIKIKAEYVEYIRHSAFFFLNENVHSYQKVLNINVTVNSIEKILRENLIGQEVKSVSKQGLSISDVSKRLRVEPQVLRYWEEELELNIPRNSQGHRCYTQEEITKLQGIQSLKEEGFLLEAIKILMPKLQEVLELPSEFRKRLCKELNEKVEERRLSGMVLHTKIHMPANNGKEPKQGDKVEQFANILANYVKKSIQDNNAVLSKEISKNVSLQMTKELNYQFQRQEEHFRKLDEAIRNKQKSKRKKLWNRSV